MESTSTKCITYIELPGTQGGCRGWFVRVTWKGKRWNKFFNVAKYSSPEDTLQAAIKWRDKIERKIGKPRTEQVMRSSSGRPTNTGHRGISRIIVKGIPYYRVNCRDKKGKGHTTQYSIRKHGETRAWKLAVRYYNRHSYAQRNDQKVKSFSRELRYSSTG